MSQDSLRVAGSDRVRDRADPRPSLVYVTGGQSDDGKWFSASFPGVRWESFRQPGQNWLERRTPKPNMTLLAPAGGPAAMPFARTPAC